MAKPLIKKLTPKQQRFVDVYDGDIKIAAKKAGITHSYAKQLMSYPKHSHVQATIKDRECTKSHSRIKTREQRQEWWSDVMGETGEKMGDRLKASELLGRSNADFTDKQEHSTDPNRPLKWQVEIVNKK